MKCKEFHSRIGRRADSKECPSDEFHILDYDYDQIQFKPNSMNSCSNAVSAIDQYGEIWYLGGYDTSGETWLNLGFDYTNKKKWYH